MCVGGWERIGVILYTGFEPISDTIDIFFISSPHGQNDHHFADGIFICILVNEMLCYIPKDAINYIQCSFR